MNWVHTAAGTRTVAAADTVGMTNTMADTAETIADIMAATNMVVDTTDTAADMVAAAAAMIVVKVAVPFVLYCRTWASSPYPLLTLSH